MSIVAITGDHPRHVYLVNRLAEAGLLSGWVRERRKPFLPEPPAGLSDRLAGLFRLHFARRDAAEARFFGQPGAPGGLALLDVTPDSLNDAPTLAFLRDRAPRLVLSYGCHKLSEALIGAMGVPFWNTHGGLSPQYRGVTTHFWPSYLLEPQMTGVTLHETTVDLDGGAVIHQSAVEMVAGDGLHDVAGRCVRAYADSLPGLLAPLMADRDAPLPRGQAQRGTGKLWLASDWRPEHLVPIYEHWDDRIVDAVLAGDLAGRVPALISVLDPALRSGA